MQATPGRPKLPASCLTLSAGGVLSAGACFLLENDLMLFGFEERGRNFFPADSLTSSSRLTAQSGGAGLTISVGRSLKSQRSLPAVFSCAHKLINNSLLVAPSIKPVVSDIRGCVEQYLHYHLSDLLHLRHKAALIWEDTRGALLGPSACFETGALHYLQLDY